MKEKTNIMDLFNEAKVNQSYLKVCAPMVRYSKVHFRTLVKNYGVDMSFTPMILADSFCQNANARASEFSTTHNDTPLIVQFAANNVDDFIDASKLVYSYSDGVDLNCGCPQRWAMKDGYGSALLAKPEIIHELVKGVKNCLPNTFSVSVKIRILKDLNKTIELCRQLEKCGVTFLTVHARTPAQKSTGDINVEALKEICSTVRIPIVANGGVKNLLDSDMLYERVSCNGVMAASGLLTNPALFSGANRTPDSCIRLWMNLKNRDSDKITFQCYHHHLVFMLEKILTKHQKVTFNNLSTFESVDDFLCKNVINSTDESNIWKYNMSDYMACQFAEEITLKHSRKCRGCGRSVCYCVCIKYDSNITEGSFFKTYVKDNDVLDYVDINIFDEE